MASAPGGVYDWPLTRPLQLGEGIAVLQYVCCVQSPTEIGRTKDAALKLLLFWAPFKPTRPSRFGREAPPTRDDSAAACG